MNRLLNEIEEMKHVDYSGCATRRKHIMLAIKNHDMHALRAIVKDPKPVPFNNTGFFECIMIDDRVGVQIVEGRLAKADVVIDSVAVPVEAPPSSPVKAAVPVGKKPLGIDERIEQANEV